MRHAEAAPKIPADLKRASENSIRDSFSLANSCLERDWPEEDYRVVLGSLAIFSGHVAFGNMMLDFDGDCQCPNCDTVFPPLGYDILKKE